MQLLFSITWGSVSGWWAPACLALGVLYAWLLYRRPVTLQNRYRYILFALRTIVVSAIAFMLLSPLVKSVTYNPQKPLILILQDNSQSVKMFEADATPAVKTAQSLSKLKSTLGDDYEVREFNFGGTLNEGLTNNFNGKQTDIAKALHLLNERFVNQNIGAVVLASDGLYNQGIDPAYEAKNFKNAFYTIAMGDTLAKRDLLIGNINFNKSAFLGNDFEIEVLAEAYQSKGESMHLTVTEDGKQVAQQNIPVNAATFHKAITLKLNADKKGLRKFNISIAPVKNEISTTNNTETIYVDVLDARQKILLLYDGPHPDISTIKQSIEGNRNYVVKAVLSADLGSIKPADYSLVILYQVSPDILPVQNLIKAKIPLWFVAGAQTNVQAFINEQKLVKISVGREDMQEVFANPSPDFTAFTLSDSSQKKISAFPPLLAPYGNYSLAAGSAVLKQRIGNVPTAYPLLAFGDDAGRRVGVLNGEGVWRWQLNEFEIYGNHHALEELFGQAVQYLTANANRQRFLAYPVKQVFDEGESVLLNAELYNDALELVNTPDVRIELKSKTGKNYSFLFSRKGHSYQLEAGTLPTGEYSFVATAKLGDRSFISNGQFTIKSLNLETRQSAANHQLLNTIAKQSGGQMLYPAQVNNLADLIRKNENIKTVVYESKHYNDIIDVKWIFAFIMVLLSIEWFLRKREGEI